MYVPEREQPQNPEDTGHGTGQGAKKTPSFCPACSIPGGRGQTAGTAHAAQQGAHRTTGTVRHGRQGRHGTTGKQARHSTAGMTGTAQYGTDGTTGTTGTTGRHDRQGRQGKHGTTGRQARHSTAAQSGRTFVRPPPPPSFPGFSAPGKFSACSRNGRRIPGRKYCGWRSPICK